MNSSRLVVSIGNSIDTVVRLLIEATMSACNNNKVEAADILAIGITELEAKLKRYAEADEAAKRNSDGAVWQRTKERVTRARMSGHVYKIPKEMIL